MLRHHFFVVILALILSACGNSSQPSSTTTTTSAPLANAPIAPGSINPPGSGGNQPICSYDIVLEIWTCF